MFRAKGILVLLACTTVFVGPWAAARIGLAWINDRRAPVTEVVLLPRFCWGQYLGYHQPQYNIPHGCGWGMNHYCQGLIYLNMSERTFGNPGRKSALLKMARGAFKYTLSMMKPYPNCPIRTDVEVSFRQANIGLMMVPGAP